MKLYATLTDGGVILLKTDISESSERFSGGAYSVRILRLSRGFHSGCLDLVTRGWCLLRENGLIDNGLEDTFR